MDVNKPLSDVIAEEGLS